MLKFLFVQCSALPADSDAYWECAIRHFTYPLYHDCCTAPMGAVLLQRRLDLMERGVAGTV